MQNSPSPHELRRLSPELAKASNKTVTLPAYSTALSQGAVSPAPLQEEMNSDILMLMQVPK